LQHLWRIFQVKRSPLSSSRISEKEVEEGDLEWCVISNRQSWAGFLGPVGGRPAGHFCRANTDSTSWSASSSGTETGSLIPPRVRGQDEGATLAAQGLHRLSRRRLGDTVVGPGMSLRSTVMRATLSQMLIGGSMGLVLAFLGEETGPAAQGKGAGHNGVGETQRSRTLLHHQCAAQWS
jgi:hypothetical protein